MSRSAARARPGQDRGSLHAEITDKIIAELEAGRLPWVQLWGLSGAGAAVGLPKSAATGRRYSGINVPILWGAVIERGFSGQVWLTFRKASRAPGNAPLLCMSVKPSMMGRTAAPHSPPLPGRLSDASTSHAPLAPSRAKRGAVRARRARAQRKTPLPPPAPPRVRGRRAFGPPQ